MSPPQDRVVQTVAGPARLPGSSHWTDDEFAAWQQHERATRAWFDGMTVAMEKLGWEFWLGHWYEDGVERGGMRARHPELAPRWVERRLAEALQAEATPNFYPPAPQAPPNLPTQRAPTFEIGEVQLRPMDLPSSSIFFMSFDPKTE